MIVGKYDVVRALRTALTDDELAFIADTIDYSTAARMLAELRRRLIEDNASEQTLNDIAEPRRG
jgi:hypothetical protein